MKLAIAADRFDVCHEEDDLNDGSSNSAGHGLVAETAFRLFSDIGTTKMIGETEQGVWAENEWRILDETGLAAAAVSEPRGGTGASLAELGLIVRAAAYHNVSLPIAETFLAEFVLSAAGFPSRSGPMTVVPSLNTEELLIERTEGGVLISGTANRVPWARHAETLVVIDKIDGNAAAIVLESPFNILNSENFANEPRDTVRFERLPVAETHIRRGGSCLTRRQVILYGALFRAAAMLGAMERIQETTLAYARDRTQFGRTLSKFQAVQQMAAVLVSQVAACAIAVQSATSSASRLSECGLEIAAAKTRISEAAGVVASLAHQIHGAIAISREYPLNFSTRRLWSWRDEYGSDVEWSDEIGRMLAGIGPSELWPYVTR